MNQLSHQEITSTVSSSASQVFSVATFYAHFHLARRGDHLVKVCQGTACHVRGARDILETAQYRLGIKTGQTTEDYKYSLERVACLGSCALAPIMVVDDTVYPQVTMKKIIEILNNNKDDASKNDIESKKS